jgi:hypothetical protein
VDLGSTNEEVDLESAKEKFLFGKHLIESKYPNFPRYGQEHCLELKQGQRKANGTLLRFNNVRQGTARD